MHPTPDQQLYQNKKRQTDEFKSALTNVATTAAGAGVAGLAGKALPWLSEFIPPGLAMKGLNKVSPKLGQFLQTGMSEGLDPREGMDFLKNGIQEEEKPKEKAKQSKNIIEKYSPELHEFILGKIKQGLTPLQAAAMATLPTTGQKDFVKIIKKITDDNKIPFDAIIESSYGSAQQAQPQQQAQTPQAPQQMQQGQPQSGQAPPGSQAMMAILQRIEQGKRQGAP